MPETSQIALKTILTYIRSFAGSMLQTSGRFYPCAVKYRDGKIEPLEAPDAHGGQLIEFLRTACHDTLAQGDYDATALAIDVWLDDEHHEDGLQVTLFSPDFPPIDLLMSWKRTATGVEYGKIRILSPDSRDDA